MAQNTKHFKCVKLTREATCITICLFQYSEADCLQKINLKINPQNEYFGINFYILLQKHISNNMVERNYALAPGFIG